MSDRIEFWAFRVAVALLGGLPRSWALRVGAGLGTLLYYLAWPYRRRGLTHLAWAFPDRSQSELRAILRASARNLGRMAAEVCHFSSLTAATLGRYVHIGNPELWQELVTEHRSRGRGLVVLTAHFGNWELLAYAHGLLGVPVTLIHRPMRNGLVDEWIFRWREQAGTRSIAKKAAAKEALKVLRQGGILAITADQNQRHSFGVFVDFFGRPACTTTGPVRLAEHTGARIVPAFIRRVGESDQHVVEVFPPVELVHTGNPERDLVENTQRCTRVIEHMIRTYPEQWIWFHQRWKTRPPEEPGRHG